MKVRLRKVGTGSVFLLALVIYGTAGLLVGVLVAVAASLPLPVDYELTILDRLGPWAMAVFPVIYGLAGGLFAALAAVLYNLAAAVTGGVRLELRELERLREGAPGAPGEAVEGTAQPDAAGAGEASAAGEEPSSSRSSGE